MLLSFSALAMALCPPALLYLVYTYLFSTPYTCPISLSLVSLQTLAVASHPRALSFPYPCFAHHHSGFYDHKRMIWQEVEGVTLCAACAPPGERGVRRKGGGDVLEGRARCNGRVGGRAHSGRRAA